jgi:hypothetical protein
MVAALAVSQRISTEVAQRSIQMRVLLAIGASLVLLMTNHAAAELMPPYCPLLW